MRRNKDSTLNGVRLLNLPEKTTIWDELTLDPEERHIYDSIEQRMQVKFKSLLKRGTILKHYSVVLVSATCLIAPDKANRLLGDAGGMSCDNDGQSSLTDSSSASNKLRAILGS